MTAALSASILGLFLLAGGGWVYLSRQRSDRARRIDLAASSLAVRYAEANWAGDDLPRWIAAR